MLKTNILILRFIIPKQQTDCEIHEPTTEVIQNIGATMTIGIIIRQIFNLKAM